MNSIDKMYTVSVRAVIYTDVTVFAANEEQAREFVEASITRERICGLTTAEFSIGDVDADEVSEIVEDEVIEDEDGVAEYETI